MSATAAATKISTGASEGYMKAAQMALMVVDKALKTGMEINNILDQKYDVILNYPMPGINGVVGLQVEL